MQLQYNKDRRWMFHQNIGVVYTREQGKEFPDVSSKDENDQKLQYTVMVSPCIYIKTSEQIITCKYWLEERSGCHTVATMVRIRLVKQPRPGENDDLQWWVGGVTLAASTSCQANLQRDRLALPRPRLVLP